MQHIWLPICTQRNYTERKSEAIANWTSIGVSYIDEMDGLRSFPAIRCSAWRNRECIVASMVSVRSSNRAGMRAPSTVHLVMTTWHGRKRCGCPGGGEGHYIYIYIYIYIYTYIYTVCDRRPASTTMMWWNHPRYSKHTSNFKPYRWRDGCRGLACTSRARGGPGVPDVPSRPCWVHRRDEMFCDEVFIL